MKALYETNLSFSANTSLLKMGQYSAAWMFCSWLVSGLQICTCHLVGAAAGIYFALSYTLSFVVGVMLYAWWLWLFGLVYSDNSICNTKKVFGLLFFSWSSFVP